MPMPVSATDSSNPVAAVPDPACPQLDLALLRELARIAQQIEQICRSRIGSTVTDAKVLLRVENQAVLVLLGKLARSANHLFDQWCELHGLRIEFKFPGLNL